MLRFNRLFTILLLVALILSACQTITTAPRMTGITAVEFTCRVTPGEEQEVDGVIHHRGQWDEGVSFASDPHLDGVYANVLDWDYVAATGGGAFVLTTVLTPTMGGGTWTGQAAGYFAGGVGGFNEVMVGAGTLAGLEFVLNGVPTELETALALIDGNERVIDGNPCAELAGEATEAFLLYGQIIDRRPVMSTPSQ
jgi:hypothetical protein